ncbi:MAG: lamin tail domain-containing protein [Verrucomicrobiia bacterium]
MNRLCVVLASVAVAWPAFYHLHALELTGSDLGISPGPGSIQTNAAGALVLTGTGGVLGLRSDQGYFAWQQREGDFDIAVRVEAVSSPDVYGRGGLMVRESLEAGSIAAGVMATPSVAGILFQARETTGAGARQRGAYPAGYPNAWLRLKREGELVTGAASADGRHWTFLDSTMLATPTLYLGLAVLNWSSNAPITAVFDDWTDAQGPIEPASTPFMELPGPSNRRTGLVISEIMFHPAERTDGRDLEFVEVFNSQGIFADISGHRLTGALEFTFPEGTILPAGGFAVVARVPEDIRAVYGLTNVLGGYAAGMDNRSGVVQLRTRINAVLQEAPYNTDREWPAAADGAGHSLVLSKPSYGELDLRAWSASGWKGGSPGAWDSPVVEPLSQVVINEVRARSRAPDLDYIELYNRGTEAVDLSSAYLSDNPSRAKFRIPQGTVIAPGGFLFFDEDKLGFKLNAGGDTAWFTASDNSRVIDALRFDAQAVGAGYGRCPNGASTVRTLASATPGTANSGPLLNDVVINELMFHPISENDDHQYVELRNRGTAAVNLAGWRFTSGIDFTFPAGVTLPAGGYLVVAKNASELRMRYPELTAQTCVGDFPNTLSGRGELVVLSRPDSVSDGGQATTVWVEVSRVRYVDGGRWGRDADGGGSSLELIDPRSDPTLAANWADSDESAKGEWTLVEHTGVLDLGQPQYGPNQLHILLENVGECLVDNVEVIGPAGTNMVLNGNFENGITGWTPQGSHRGSAVESSTGIDGSQCLHVRAESRGDPGANRIRVNVATGLRDGQTATLRAWVRWLRGSQEILVRLRGNHLEAAGRMQISAALGTPGQRNSRAVSNAPPAIYDVAHWPVLPANSQPVVVTARVHDPDGLSSLVLRYRVDPSSDLVEVPMLDDGMGGDSVAGDGHFSGTIPGGVGTLVAFHLVATDRTAVAASATFPTAAPERECLVRFGETQYGGTFGTYRIWMTQATRSRWTSREKLSNAPLDVTFVYGNQRAIYNAGSYYAGSPFVSGGYTGPTGALCGYVVHVPEDDRFLGATEMKLDWPVRDSSLQYEQVAYWIADELRIPSNHRRFIYLFVNGLRRATLYEDAQQPNSDMVAQYFPEDDDGDLYKIDDWFEFDNSASGFVNTDATLANFTTAGGEKKVARYRWNWRKRAVKESASDYRSLFALVDATQDPSFDGFTRKVESNLDVEEFLRIIAFEHIVGNWDSFGYGRGKNMSAYRPKRGKWSLITWDIDFVLSAQGDPPESYLFGTIDPAVSRMMFHPPFQRVYFRAMSDAMNGPLQASKFGPVLGANYASFQNNGVTASLISGGSNYLSARARSIRSQLNEVSSSFGLTLTGNSITTPDNLFILQGTAPVEVRDITVNGVSYPTRWLDVTRWEMSIPLTAVSNELEVAATDSFGRPVGTAKTLTVRFTGSADSPEDSVVFNEIMFRPDVDRGEFIELHNVSTSTAFNLSDWQVNGLDFTLPRGTLLEPGGFLVIARDPAAFWEAYGPEATPVGWFNGRLAPEGEKLRLIRPGGVLQDAIVSEVEYGARPPWPEPATQGGVSLQLRDPTHDQSRAGNWGVRLPEAPSEWERVSVTGTATSPKLLIYLAGFPPVRDYSTIEGRWDGTLLFGQDRFTFAVDFRPAAKGWTGDFVFTDGAQEQRQPLGQVTLTNNLLTFGFTPQEAEFRFPIADDEPMTLNGRYQPSGQPAFTAILTRTSPGGAIYLDDVWLCKGTVPQTGVNLVRNGSFEAALDEGWTLGTNLLQSVITPDFKHDGNSSLHLVAASGGHNESNSLWQDVAGLEPGEEYTLSYWKRREATARGLVVRLGDWSLASAQDLRPVPALPVAHTPGRANSNLEQLPEWPALWINEFSFGVPSGAAGGFGQKGAWLELFNAGSTAISLQTFLLGNSYSNQIAWAFPEGAAIDSGEFRLVWLDGGSSPSTASEWHANFLPTAPSGSLVLWRQSNNKLQLVDYLDYSGLATGQSTGWAADGHPGERVLFPQATPLGSNTGPASGVSVFINEWLAANSETVADPADGRFDDWVELFNAGAAPVDLGGYGLSDSPADPRKLVIPPGTVIPAKGYLVIWTDGEPEQTRPTSLHANFRLSADGESIVLSAPDGKVLDLVTFGPQVQDVSEGRWPDGSATGIRPLTSATPGAANLWVGELAVTELWLNASGEIEAVWASTPGQQFQVQFKDDLNDPVWLNFGAPIVATGSETRAVFGNPTTGQRFFRLMAAP